MQWESRKVQRLEKTQKKERLWSYVNEGGPGKFLKSCSNGVELFAFLLFCHFLCFNISTFSEYCTCWNSSPSALMLTKQFRVSVNQDRVDLGLLFICLFSYLGVKMTMSIIHMSWRNNHFFFSNKTLLKCHVLVNIYLLMKKYTKIHFIFFFLPARDLLKFHHFLKTLCMLICPANLQTHAS